jgi:hypothetical protein
MTTHGTMRKLIAATVISTALVLSAVGARAASADGGAHTESLEVAHVGLKPAGAVPEPASTKYKDIELKPPLHQATYKVVLERGSLQAASGTALPAPASGPVATYNFTEAWPWK